MIHLSFFTTITTHRSTQYRQPTKEQQNVTSKYRKVTKCIYIYQKKESYNSVRTGFLKSSNISNESVETIRISSWSFSPLLTSFGKQ